jgi:hypothetical protein
LKKDKSFRSCAQHLEYYRVAYKINDYESVRNLLKQSIELDIILKAAKKNDKIMEEFNNLLALCTIIKKP